jgi:membrane protease YdiL (CAAX protease family)
MGTAGIHSWGARLSPCVAAFGEPAVSARGFVRFVALAVIVIVLAGFWAARSRLQGLGLDFLAWNRTPRYILLKAVGCGIAAALAVAWLFRGIQTGALPSFADLTMGVTLGPLVEELVFRGILFYLVLLLLSRWLRNAGWPTVVVIAAVFAVSHAGKAGITVLQIATIFLTGTLYGWLRKGSGSTVPPFCAHVAYNAVLLGIAFLR